MRTLAPDAAARRLPAQPPGRQRYEHLKLGGGSRQKKLKRASQPGSIEVRLVVEETVEPGHSRPGSTEKNNS